MNPPEGWVRIGKVVAPQGLAGEVRVGPLTDFPQRFLATEQVALELAEGPRLLQVEGARLHGNVAILRLAEDRAGAEALRGVFLLVREEELVPLPQDQYYIYQLMGLSVYTEEGQFLGKIREVMATGGNDVWVVARDGEDLLLPAIRQVIRQVDLAAGRIVVHLLPGLVD